MTINFSSIKTNVRRLSPSSKDVLIALGLFLFLLMQFLFSSGINNHRPPHMPAPNSLAHSLPLDGFAQTPSIRTALALTLIGLVCIALIFRREAPWSVLLFTTCGAALYTVLPFNPVFIFVAPLLAIYTVTSSSSKNTRWVVAFIGAALALCLIALTYGTERWTIELVGFTALLAVAALFGNVRRSDLAYLHEAQQRALEAERTREQEAQKRVEAERVAIAREVHDIVAHSISTIAIQSAAADTLIDKQPEAAHEAVANIRTTSKQALSELRGMISVLRNDSVQDAPLAPVASLPALDEIIERVRNAGIEARVDNQANNKLPVPVSVSAYRIIQEALTNMLRHSNATSVQIKVTQSLSQLMVTVADNGTYIPSEAHEGGHGLQGMRERCEAFGGSLTTSPLESTMSTPVEGFEITAVLPFAHENEQD